MDIGIGTYIISILVSYSLLYVLGRYKQSLGGFLLVCIILGSCGVVFSESGFDRNTFALMALITIAGFVGFFKGQSLKEKDENRIDQRATPHNYHKHSEMLVYEKTKNLTNIMQRWLPRNLLWKKLSDMKRTTVGTPKTYPCLTSVTILSLQGTEKQDT